MKIKQRPADYESSFERVAPVRPNKIYIDRDAIFKCRMMTDANACL